jgi:coronin-1B/1C/6
LQEVKAHEGAKPAQAVYCKNDKIFTAGFSRMSARQYALWDEVYIFFSLFSTNIS